MLLKQATGSSLLVRHHGFGVLQAESSPNQDRPFYAEGQLRCVGVKNRMAENSRRQALSAAGHD